MTTDDTNITPGFYRIDGLGTDREGCVFVRVTRSLPAAGLYVWGMSVCDADGNGPTAEYRTRGCSLADALALWPREQWHPDHDRRAEAQAEHDARTADTRMVAHRLTVTPATLHKAEGLGFEPGSGDVLTWALMEIEDRRATYTTACSVATGLNNMLSKAEAERDAAQAEIVKLRELCSEASGMIDTVDGAAYLLSERLRVAGDD